MKVRKETRQKQRRLVILCARAAQHGMDTLTPEEQFRVLQFGDDLGVPYEDAEDVQSYCEIILERVVPGEHLKRRKIAQPSPRPLPPRRRAQKPKSTPPLPQDCVFEAETLERYGWDTRETCGNLDEASGVPLDDLMYSEIEPDRLVRVRCGGQLYCYDVSTLHSILENDPRDPITRTPLSNEFQEGVRRRYSDVTGRESDPMIERALLELDVLFEPVESILTFAERIPAHIRQLATREVMSLKEEWRARLRDEELDAYTRIYLLFGEPQDPGDAVQYIEDLRARLLEMEFGE